MNYQMLDFLEKIISDDIETDNVILKKEGVLTIDDSISQNKINLMSGAYASKLIDNIIESDMRLHEILSYIEKLQKQNQYMGIYILLLYMFSAFEMEIPYLFMQLSTHKDALCLYINELVADMKDCIYDQVE